MAELVLGDALYESTEKLISENLVTREDVVCLQEAGVTTFTELKSRMREGMQIDGLGTQTLSLIYQEAQKIMDLYVRETNVTKTLNTIGRKAQMRDFDKKRKRLEDLEVTIALGDGTRPAQIAHWERERDSLRTKIQNMRNNNKC